MFYLKSYLKSMDTDRDGQVNFEEFRYAIWELCLSMTEQELRDLFHTFDKSHTGKIEIRDFLEKVVGIMSFD